ncbi:hypothetical protein H257_04275 [Aphanomyces astaci]|uniref:Uncharacterized protein n=1 Tax=Aphanomyces astaci TaxID=112090 RepID=W4GW95_APHAT|nr:hypothetical protein H257_04275 [Aphanomyces astaci]ETV83576.1 hypothetical protein H257_04275 [Aphanomyces astaci]|eukprot:XP_009827006.1 hypothetical protein H257_04275 [Aphanomyces astaci]
MDLRTVRIAVVGDSGVGKTSLVHFVCHGTVLAHPTWTIGCTTEVLLHQNDTFVEFVDIGGNPRYELSRAAFYHELHGIIFVYDMSNIRSYNNLRKWITELSLAQKNRPHAVANPDNIGALPTLVIGNKQDAVHTQRMAPLRDLKMDSLEASAMEGRLDLPRFHLFLDRVIATAFTSTPRQSSHGIVRNRGPTSTASPHGTPTSASTKSSWWS